MTSHKQISTENVRRRRVFYIPGYDPIHPRRYRELYRKEGKSQANISGYDLSIKARKATNTYGWEVSTTTDGEQVQTSIDVLVWSDIVRDSMSTDIPQTYLQLMKTAWIYLSTGALFRLMKLRKGPILAALYPVFMLLIQLVIAVLIGWGVARLGRVLPNAIAFVWFWTSLFVIPIFILRYFKSKDRNFFAYYLMHDFAFSAKDNGAIAPELTATLQKFCALIADALNDDLDEVLVVGHSSGAHLGVCVLADLIRNRRAEFDRPKLSFLTLGHVVPMLTFLPNSNQLRGDLQFLSERDELCWIDVTAPGDGCAFALCDPVAVSGVATENQRWPLVFSAAFTQSLSAARWKELRWRFFRLHFQYLCAFDRPKDYDYFQITAGPLTLEERYKNRPQSKSRIKHAVSGYRSVS